MGRWKLIVFITFLVFLLGAVLLWFYLFPMDGLESRVSSQLNNLASEKYGLDVTIGNIGGDVLSGITLEDVVVRYTDSTMSYELARIKTVVADFKFSNIWRKDYSFGRVEVDSLELLVHRDSAGIYHLPSFGSGSDSTRKTQPPAIVIDDAVIEHANLTVIRPGDTLWVREFSLAASLGVESGMLSADIRRMAFVVPTKDLELTSATGKVTFSEGRLLFQDLSVVSREIRTRLNGAVQVKDLLGHLEFSMDHIDLAQVHEFGGPKLRGVLDLTGRVSFDRSTLDGTVNMAGDFMIASLENLQVDFHFEDRILSLDTVYGTILGNCSVDGAALIDFTEPTKTYQLDASIRNFNLKQLIKNSFESDLNGRLFLDGTSFRSQDMLLMADVELYESSFDDYPIQYAEGPIAITTDSISFPKTFTVHYYENVFRATGTVAYREDMKLSIEADLRNLDRYKDKLFISDPGGRATATATLAGETSNPDLTAHLVSDSIRLYGLVADSCVSDVYIEKFLNERQGWARADFVTGQAWGNPFDTAFAYLSLDSQIVYIDSCAISSSQLAAEGQGIFDYGVYPSQLILDQAGLTLFGPTFTNIGRIDIGIDSTGFDFRRLAFRNSGGEFSVTGMMHYDETMNLTVLADSILMAPWVKLFQSEMPIDGYASCRGRLQGAFANPIMELDGSIDSLTYKELKLGDLVTTLSYQDRLLSIDSVVVTSDSGRYRGSGYMNAELALVADSLERIPDLPFDLQVTAYDNRFDLVSFLLPSVEQMEGDFTADIHLTGTPSDPHLEGSSSLIGGRLKYFDLVEDIYTDTARITMRDNRIELSNVVAYVIDNKKKDTSYVYIGGDITVKALDNFVYDLDVSIPRALHFTYELEDIEGVVEGELQVQGETPPTVSGDLTLTSARYRVPFAEANEGSPVLAALTQQNSWNLDLNIDILSNYWIQNEDIDAEFSGNINLIRDRGRYRFIGEMDILRGKGFLFDKVLRIDQGSEVIFEDIEYLNPRLDITARTRIAGIKFDEEDSAESIELGVHITGTLDVPEINTVEDSEFSREDILPLIALNYYGSGSEGYNGALEQRVTQLVGAQVSRIGTRQLGRLGVETFEIDPVYGGEFDLAKSRVTLGLYTLPGLYVYGKSALSGNTGQEVGFEYRISRQLMVLGQRTEEEEYLLNLKLNWEF